MTARQLETIEEEAAKSCGRRFERGRVAVGCIRGHMLHNAEVDDRGIRSKRDELRLCGQAACMLVIDEWTEPAERAAQGAAWVGGPFPQQRTQVLARVRSARRSEVAEQRARLARWWERKNMRAASGLERAEQPNFQRSSGHDARMRDVLQLHRMPMRRACKPLRRKCSIRAAQVQETVGL